MPAMPPMPPRNIDRIRTDLLSASPDVRRNAIQVLSYWVSQDRSIGAAALPLFRHAWRHETDPWSVVTAARGIERTAGAEEGRAALLDLLERPDQEIVASAVMNLERELSSERLLAILSGATHVGLRRAVVNVLGRKGGAGVFEVLTRAIDEADLRPYAIVALERLNDPAAIPYIERCLSDTTEAWCEDRGPMLRVCDVASDAIGQLRNSRERPAVPARAVHAAAPAAPWAGAASTSAGQRAAGMQRLLGTLLPQPGPESKGTLYAIAPLAAALIMIPWVLMFVIGVISVTGKAHDTADRTRAMDLVAILPPAIGVAVGVYGIAKRRVRGAVRRTILGAGCVLCILVSLPFLNEARDITFHERQSRAAAPAPASNPPAKRVPIPSGTPPPMEERQPVEVRLPVASQP